jgi:hypothetical protein
MRKCVVMNRFLLAAALACAAAPTSGAAVAARRVPGVPLTTIERRALDGAAAPGLAELRGGGAAGGAALCASEAGALRAAEARAPELAALRGGDVCFDDRELKIIGVTALAVLLLVWLL